MWRCKGPRHAVRYRLRAADPVQRGARAWSELAALSKAGNTRCCRVGLSHGEHLPLIPSSSASSLWHVRAGGARGFPRPRTLQRADAPKSDCRAAAEIMQQTTVKCDSSNAEAASMCRWTAYWRAARWRS